MSESFDVNAYWSERGRHYNAESRLAGDYHKLQESFLVDVLKLARVPMHRVLEIGCGFGRVTKLLAESFPDVAITAVDLSSHQLERARLHCTACRNVNFASYDFYSGLPLPGENYDAVIAVEVFLHHPREAVQRLIANFATAARHIVNIDWCEDWRAPVSEHVWIHNYRVLYQQSRWACVGFALPQRVDGKQQRLFLGTPSLSDELVRIERLLSHYGRYSSEPSWGHEDGTPRAKPPVNWSESVRQAEEDLQRVIPDGATFVLADGGQWGNSDALGRRQVLPFLERQGHYWGPPTDDETAVAELERMRQLGAVFFALAWPAFWWMDYYAGFGQHLRRTFPCVLENDRLLIFQLV